MIDRCPQCQYLLAGLPHVYRCPECAFQYEVDSEVVKDYRTGWAYLGLVYGGMLAVGIILIAWRGAYFLFLLGVLYAIVALWRFLRPRQMVIVSLTELRVLGRDEPEKRYPLADIQNAKWSWIAGEVQVIGHDGADVTTIRSTFLYSHRRVKRLAAAINEYVSKRDSLGTP